MISGGQYQRCEIYHISSWPDKNENNRIAVNEVRV